MLRHRQGYVASCRVAYRERRSMRSSANRVSIRRSLKVINERQRGVTSLVNQILQDILATDRMEPTAVHSSTESVTTLSTQACIASSICCFYRNLIRCFWNILNNAHWCQRRSFDACWCRGHNTSFLTQRSQLRSGSATCSTRNFLG